VAAVFGGESPAQAILTRIREKLAARLAEVFKIMDDDNSHELDFTEFRKAVRDFRLEIPEDDVSSQHVRSGKKTQDKVLNEFLETFEMHHNISDRNEQCVAAEGWSEERRKSRGIGNNHRSQFGGTVASNAPHIRNVELLIEFQYKYNRGTFDTPQDWTTAEAEGARSDLLQIADTIPTAGAHT
jgi:hypothetical protein